MNIAKLRHMSARAMGWQIITDDSMRGYPATFYQKPDGTRIFWQKWNPCEDLNDASALLEKVSRGGKWAVEHPPVRGWSGSEYVTDDGLYRAWLSKENGDSKYATWAKTEALAKTLCALRAAGIPESSITEGD